MDIYEKAASMLENKYYLTEVETESKEAPVKLPKISGWNSTKIKELKDWYDRYAGDKDGSFEDLCKLISDNAKIGNIGKKFPSLHSGLEYVRMANKKDDEIQFAYLNAGDTYAPTILRDPFNSKIKFTSIGDIIEYAEKKGYETV